MKRSMKKDVMVLDSKKTLRWTLYLTGGILIALGLWAMTYPMEALMSLAFSLGVGFVLAGINHLVPCFSLRGDPMYPRWMLVQGVLDLLIGIVMLMRLGVTAFMIPIMVACWFSFTRLLTATSVPVRSDVSANRKRLKRRTSTPSAAALSSPSISALRDRP